jgi:hypothetical protein
VNQLLGALFLVLTASSYIAAECSSMPLLASCPVSITRPILSSQEYAQQQSGPDPAKQHNSLFAPAALLGRVEMILLHPTSEQVDINEMMKALQEGIDMQRVLSEEMGGDKQQFQAPGMTFCHL